MAHRNPQRKAGPGLGLYKGTSDKVEKEAMKRASGGKCVPMSDDKPSKRIDKRARGGSVNGKSPFSSAGGGSADKNPIFK